MSGNSESLKNQGVSEIFYFQKLLYRKNRIKNKAERNYGIILIFFRFTYAIGQFIGQFFFVNKGKAKKRSKMEFF